MNTSDLARNEYKLNGPLAKNGYDWWWHNFTGRHQITGEEKAFYIEYFFINPDISPAKVQLGQDGLGLKPSYFMMNVGTWGEHKKQLHNFYPINQVSIGNEGLELSVGPNILTETAISGSCFVSNEMASVPAHMSDAGEMIWDLKVDKQIAYNVGYGAGRFMQKFNAFEMFWHAEGIKTLFEGYVIIDGEKYLVDKDTSYGYSDKNWGKDYTSPWLWLSSCHLVSRVTNKRLENSAIELGGGKPRILGIPINSKVLVGLYYEGEMIEFNFSKFWKRSHIDFSFKETNTHGLWHVSGTNKDYTFTLEIQCPLNHMLEINYEAPNGKKLHNHLLNGGTGEGNLKLYDQHGKLIDDIDVYHTGCEYGEF